MKEIRQTIDSKKEQIAKLKKEMRNPDMKLTVYFRNFQKLRKLQAGLKEAKRELQQIGQ